MAKQSQVGAQALDEPDLLPPRAGAVGTHRRVLEAALLAFGERGFHGVTLREVAKMAGIHVSSIYGHIPSKEMLLYELTVLGHEEHYEQISCAVAAAGEDVTERVKAYVRAHVHVHITYQMMARVSNKELHALSKQRQKKIMEIRTRSGRLLVDLVEEGTSKGIFRPRDTWLAAVMIIDLGVRVADWWTPETPYPTVEVEDVIVDAALRILGVAS